MKQNKGVCSKPKVLFDFFKADVSFSLNDFLSKQQQKRSLINHQRGKGFSRKRAI